LPNPPRPNAAEIAIFDATERLLADQPLGALSVAAIIEQAGVSRATFYNYFGSKYAVMSGLLARVMDDAFALSVPFLQQQRAGSIIESLQISLQAAVELWARHRIVLQAVMETFPFDPWLESQWTRQLARFADEVALEVDDERHRGTLPSGLDSHSLAVTLVWSTERCLFVAGRGLDPSMADEHAAVDALVALWAGALHLGRAAA